MAAGVMLICSGMMLSFYCAVIFRFIGEGTPSPVAPTTKLVIKGVYKHSRNPIYISFLLILTGMFLLFGHVMLLLYVLLASIALHVYITAIEEPELEERFGDEYIEYKKAVPRWIIK